jgi:hypothetical protein
VEDLPCAIVEFLAAWNEDPKPFVWTATVESSQQKLSRCRQTLEQIQPGCTQLRIRKTKKTAQLILGHYTRVISLLQICPGPSSGKAAWATSPLPTQAVDSGNKHASFWV